MTADNSQIHEQVIIFCLNQIYWKFEIIADKIFWKVLKYLCNLNIYIYKCTNLKQIVSSPVGFYVTVISVDVLSLKNSGSVILQKAI